MKILKELLGIKDEQIEAEKDEEEEKQAEVSSQDEDRFSDIDSELDVPDIPRYMEPSLPTSPEELRAKREEHFVTLRIRASRKKISVII